MKRQYAVQDCDGEQIILIVAANSEKEALVRFVNWYKDEEIPGYEDMSLESFDELYSICEVQSI